MNLRMQSENIGLLKTNYIGVLMLFSEKMLRVHEKTILL